MCYACVRTASTTLYIVCVCWFSQTLLWNCDMGSKACAAAAHRVQLTTLPADNDTYFHVHIICCISGLLSGAASCSDRCTFYSCVGICVTMGHEHSQPTGGWKSHMTYETYQSYLCPRRTLSLTKLIIKTCATARMCQDTNIRWTGILSMLLPPNIHMHFMHVLYHGIAALLGFHVSLWGFMLSHSSAT